MNETISSDEIRENFTTTSSISKNMTNKIFQWPFIFLCLIINNPFVNLHLTAQCWSDHTYEVWRTQKRTFPDGNFARNSLVVLVSPNTNLSEILTCAPLYWAAMRALKARKLSGYVYRVWKNYIYFFKLTLLWSQMVIQSQWNRIGSWKLSK